MIQKIFFWIQIFFLDKDQKNTQKRKNHLRKKSQGSQMLWHVMCLNPASQPNF